MVVHVVVKQTKKIHMWSLKVCGYCNFKQTNTELILMLISALVISNAHPAISATDHVLVSRKLSTVKFYYSQQVHSSVYAGDLCDRGSALSQLASALSL